MNFTEGDVLNRKQFRLCGIITTAGMGALFGWSIAIGNFVLPTVAVILGTVVLYLCKRRVEEVTEDERIYIIAEKASRGALQIFILTSAVIGVTLVALSRSGYPEVAPIGFTLVYSACALLMSYIVLYGYYNRKYGV